MIAAHRSPTQAQVILQHLLDGKSLTSLEALELHGCFRLAARIHELRRDGYIIHEQTVSHNGKRYTRYSIPTFKLEYA